MEFLKEFIRFFLKRKKYWLGPILFAFLLLGGLIILTEVTALGPVIYTIF